MASYLDGTGLGHLIEKIKAAFVAKADTATVTGLDIDSAPTANSTNLVTSGGVYTAIQNAGGGGGTTVEANPTVPSGTTPTDVKGLKIGNDYYDICAVHLDITNNDIDSAINTAWV